MSEGAGPHPDAANVERVDDRDESETERLDRNWAELLQELRVIQTGTQILTGFLLTLAFQPRFSDLDQYQVDTYLGLVISAGLATILALTPVSLHRVLFRKRAKAEIVLIANRLLKVTLAAVAITLVGTIMLIFDVVIGRQAGWIAGASTLVLVILAWLVLPLGAGRARQDG